MESYTLVLQKKLFGGAGLCILGLTQVLGTISERDFHLFFAGFYFSLGALFFAAGANFCFSAPKVLSIDKVVWFDLEKMFVDKCANIGVLCGFTGLFFDASLIFLKAFKIKFTNYMPNFCLSSAVYVQIKCSHYFIAQMIGLLVKVLVAQEIIVEYILLLIWIVGVVYLGFLQNRFNKIIGKILADHLF